MNSDHSLGFFAGLAGGVVIGVLCARRSQPTLRKLVACKAKDKLDEVKHYTADLADSAAEMASKGKAGVVRRQEALINAFDAGVRAYQKTAG